MTMDLQRSLLIGVIAVLSFMLLTNWVAFNDKHKAAQVNAQYAQPNTPAAASTDSQAELPTAVPVPDSTMVAIMQRLLQ